MRRLTQLEKTRVKAIATVCMDIYIYIVYEFSLHVETRQLIAFPL